MHSFINKPYQNHPPRLRNRLVVFIFSTTLIFLLTSYSPAAAEELTSSGYIIQMGTINITSGTKSSPSFKIVDTVGQVSPGDFATTGYRLKSGFTYLPSTQTPFGLTISTSSINFGSLIANTFSASSLSLTVNHEAVPGYSVNVIENHPLSLADSTVFIPDTACDAKAKCTPSHASAWTQTSTFGFGYNIQGDGVDQTEFQDDTYFRPFANNSLNQNPVTVMASSSLTSRAPAKATLTLKVNISPLQANGSYENAIQLIALPSY